MAERRANAWAHRSEFTFDPHHVERLVDLFRDAIADRKGTAREGPLRARLVDLNSCDSAGADLARPTHTAGMVDNAKPSGTHQTL